jgi:hypothetical protein
MAGRFSLDGLHAPADAQSAFCEELSSIALSLPSRVELNPKRRFRPIGVGLSNFDDPVAAPTTLFD